MQEACLLVFSPHPIVRHAVTEVLRGGNWVREVGEAQTGQEALEWAQARHPDIVLIEVRLPDLSGLEIARQLKTLPSAPHIVLLTRSSVKIYRDLSQVLGVDTVMNLRHFVTEFRTFLDTFEQEGRQPRAPRVATRGNTVSRGSGVREMGREH